MKIGSYGYTAENTNRSKLPWTIYHNPRCSKSREALDLLRINDVDPNIVEYLVTPPKKHELLGLLQILQVKPREIIRTKEAIFSTLTVDLENAEQVIDAILKHPELLERPIVVHAGKAVIARPPDRVLELKTK